MKKMDIIISKYKEDISWVSGFKKNKVFIYDKSGDDNGFINLPNVGREAHTYLVHIIENYDHLPDYLCFLQGNPFDHLKYSIDQIDNIDLDSVDIDFIDLSKTRVMCQLHFCSHLMNWNVEILPLYETYKKIYNREFPDFTFIFGAGAQFIVSKKSILRNSKKIYENAIKTVDNSIKPEEAYCLERLWPVIFLGEETFQNLKIK